MSHTKPDVAGEDPVVAKQALRAHLEHERARLDAATLAARAAGLAEVALDQPELARARTVAAYVSIGSEPGTGPLIERLHQAGIRILLPITVRRPADATAPSRLELEWAAYDGPDSLVPARMGLWEPSGPRLGTWSLGEVDLVFAPGMAVSKRGDRLGKGAGCYDRALAHLAPHAPVWVLVYDSELGRPVPREPHDRPVTAALTPTRFVPLSQA